LKEKNISKSGQLVTSSNRKLTNLIPLNNLDYFNPTRSSNSIKPQEEPQKEEEEEEEEVEIKKDSIEIRKEKKIFILGNNYPSVVSTFQELKQYPQVRSYLMSNVENGLGFKIPTPVQMQVIPILLSKRECLVAAPTGSGKTLSYAFPILANLKKPGKEGFRALVILPTAVLAQQISREFDKFAKGKDWRIVNLDKSKKQMEKKLKSNRNGSFFFSFTFTDILIATPKKLVELLKEEVVSLEK
jgi:ATP-dependent RNA helicase DDX52/ROK1